MMTIKQTKRKKISMQMISKIIIMLTAIAMVFAFSCSMIGMDSAFAVDYNDSDYVNQLSPRAWDSDLLTDNPELGVQHEDGTTFSNQLSDFLLKLGVTLISITTIVCSVRLIVRGVYELMFYDESSGIEKGINLPSFFFSRSESQGSGKVQHSDSWLKEMLIESGIYIGIALGAGTIVMVLLGIATAVLNFAIGDAPNQLSTFSFGGVSVTSK